MQSLRELAASKNERRLIVCSSLLLPFGAPSMDASSGCHSLGRIMIGIIATTHCSSFTSMALLHLFIYFHLITFALAVVSVFGVRFGRGCSYLSVSHGRDSLIYLFVFVHARCPLPCPQSCRPCRRAILPGDLGLSCCLFVSCLSFGGVCFRSGMSGNVWRTQCSAVSCPQLGQCVSPLWVRSRLSSCAHTARTSLSSSKSFHDSIDSSVDLF